MKSFALLVMVHCLDLSRLVRDQNDFGASLLQGVPWCCELYLLYAICSEKRDFTSFELGGHTIS